MAVLILIFAVANMNAAHWLDVLSNASKGFRGIGDEARAVCGPKENDIVGIGTAEQYIPLYYAAFGVDRAIPLRIIPKSDTRSIVAASPAGGCVITQLRFDDAVARKMDESSGLILYRVGK